MTTSENQCVLSVAQLRQKGLAMSEPEMVYCAKCREFFEADSSDLGTYFCERCRVKKNNENTKRLDEVMRNFVNEFLEKQKTKGIK